MRIRAACLAAVLLAAARPAAAQPALLGGGQELDEETGELVLFLAGRAADGSPAPVVEPQLYLDGSGPYPPAGRDKLLEYAADRPKWVAPVAIGVVYLWATGTPQTLMDGLENLFRHVPAKVAVYPTPYGQGHRKVVTKLTAARVAGGDLADYPQLPGDQHRLVPAVQFNAAKLAEDRSPLKLLFIVTDGREPAANREFGPFSTLGEELRRKGIYVTIVALPAEIDAAEATANLQELGDAAHGRRIPVERKADIPAIVESLAETVLAFERVHFELPWLARQIGGDRRLVVRAIVAGGSVRTPTMALFLPRRPGVLVALILLVLGAAGGGTYVFLKMRARPATPRRTFGRTPPRRETRSPREAPRRPEPDVEESQDEAESLPADPRTEAAREVARVGASPARAVLALSRVLGPEAEAATEPGDREEALGTRAGQNRLREIGRLLATNAPRPVFVHDLAPILAGTLREQAPAAEGARRLRARLPLEVWTALLRLPPEQTDGALNESGLPELATPAARAFVREVQTHLRRPAPRPAVTLWLVRVSGPGTHGESLVLRGTAVLGGRGSETVLSAADDQLAKSHAQVTIDGNDAFIAPRDGAVHIDGTDVTAPTPLHDGQTVALGRSLYVVRMVRRGIVLPQERGRRR
jgi:hypothetical protein